MTRINANIPVKFLSDHHLRAEQKEIARLPMLFRTRLNYTGNINGKFNQDLPKKFTLGNGHLLFFMDKGRWAWERANQLTLEMFNQGMQPINHNQMVWEEFAMYDMDSYE